MLPGPGSIYQELTGIPVAALSFIRKWDRPASRAEDLLVPVDKDVDRQLPLLTIAEGRPGSLFHGNGEIAADYDRSLHLPPDEESPGRCRLPGIWEKRRQTCFADMVKDAPVFMKR